MKKNILYFRGLKTALFRARIKYGRSSISFNKKPRASARGASFIAGCLLSAAIYGCGSEPQLYKEARILMGTFVEVKSPQQQALKIAFDEIERIDNLLNKYKENSEVSILNREGRLYASNDTLYIIQKAKEFWQASNGAFDITVGPLMEIWGFTDKNYRQPQKEDIDATLARVGFDKISITGNLIEFKVPGMKIDLGAVGKGYAVDCAVKKLNEKGVKSCLISAAGDIYCLGLKSGKPWSVAVKNPRGDGYWGRLELYNEAVSTSGDYEQYFIKDGIRRSHIMNPKTGIPTESGIASVTVIAPDALTADALATAIFTLGKEKSTALLKNYPGVKVKIIEAKNVSYNK